MQHAPDSPELSSKKLAVIAMLARGVSVADAAKQTGAGRSTIYLWLSSDDFSQELDLQQQIYIERITAALTTAADEAVACLSGIVKDSDDDAIRVRAALGLLSQVPKWREVGTIARKMKSIEDMLTDVTS